MTSPVLSLEENGIFFGRATSAVSEDAKEIDEKLAMIRCELASTRSVGWRDLQIKKQLRSTLQEANCDGWDGMGAKRFSPEALVQAVRLINVLPTWVPAPECTVDPDGEIGLDWFSEKNEVLSVSVGTDGRVSYAGRFGLGRVHGSEYLVDELPEPILANLRRLLSSSRESLAA